MIGFIKRINSSWLSCRFWMFLCSCFTRFNRSFSWSSLILYGEYSWVLTIIFQRIMAIFLAVAIIAATLPFPKAILLKNGKRSLSFWFPIELATCLKAVAIVLLPFLTRLHSILPPLTLLFGTKLSQEAKLFAVENYRYHPQDSSSNIEKYYGLPQLWKWGLSQRTDVQF